MKEVKVYATIIAVLAILLLPAVAHLLRVPAGFVVLMILIPLCPCITTECVNCACDDCVNRVLVGGILVLVGSPLLLYLPRKTRSFR